jgi:hypothetical protein
LGLLNFGAFSRAVLVKKMSPPPPMQVEEHEEEQTSTEMIEDSEFGPLSISKLEVKRLRGSYGYLYPSISLLYFIHALLS